MRRNRSEQLTEKNKENKKVFLFFLLPSLIVLTGETNRTMGQFGSAIPSTFVLLLLEFCIFGVKFSTF